MTGVQLRMVPAQERLLSPVLVALGCVLAAALLVAFQSGEGPRVLGVLLLIVRAGSWIEDLTGGGVALFEERYASSSWVAGRIAGRERRRALWARGVARSRGPARLCAWAVAAVVACAVTAAMLGVAPPRRGQAGPALGLLRVAGHVAGYGLCVFGPVALFGQRLVADWRRAASSPLCSSAVVRTGDLATRLATPGVKAVLQPIVLVLSLALILLP